MPKYKLTASDLEVIKDLFHSSDLMQKQVGALFNVKATRICTLWSRWFSPKEREERARRSYSRLKLGELNPMYGKCRELNPRHKPVVGDNKGYLMVLKPDWYTGRKRSRHVFQHSVVVCEKLGITEIPRGWSVHHCDRNPHNNEFGNLVLIKSGDHSRLHAWFRREGVTTISKESTLKWVEANGTPWKQRVMI